MPTNDERREVAARLRDYADSELTDNEIWWGLRRIAYGGDYSYLHHASYELLKRLADLIEPEPERTCRVYIGEGTESGWWVCGSCGDLFDTLSSLACKRGRNSMPNYCPNCGAKAVGE